MKRFALTALLLCIALTAHAQGKGFVKSGVSNRLSLVPADQFITVTYPWDFAPVGTSNGWYVQQSTSSGVTVAAQAPLLVLTGATADRRVGLFEGPSAAGFNLGSVMSVSADGEVTIGVAIYGLDQVQAGSAPWFQLAYGDTTNWVVDKIPNAGFGIIVTGSSLADTLIASQNTISAYVSDGSDTTYVPIATNSGTDVVKLYIHADPGGGPVAFWIDDVLKATIAAPARVNAGNSACSIWLNGGASLAPLYLGPLTIQRAWQ